MPPYCRGSKHQKNGLAPLEERKRLCDPPNLPNLISFICLFPINMQPLALFLRKEPGGLSSISAGEDSPAWKVAFDHARRHHPLTAASSSCSRRHSRSLHRRKGSWVTIRRERGRGRSTVTISFTRAGRGVRT